MSSTDYEEGQLVYVEVDGEEEGPYLVEWVGSNTLWYWDSKERKKKETWQRFVRPYEND